MRYKYDHCLLGIACVWLCVACNNNNNDAVNQSPGVTASSVTASSVTASSVTGGTVTRSSVTGTSATAPDAYEIYTYAEFPNATGDLAHLYPLYIYKYGDTAAQIASGLNQQPVGRRGLLQWGQEFGNGTLDIQLTGNPLDTCVNGKVATNYQCPWLSNGTALLKPQFQKLYDSLKQAGATLDAAIFDSEPDFINFWAYENYLANPATTPSWLPSAIDQDPRFSTMLVPALQALYAT